MKYCSVPWQIGRSQLEAVSWNHGEKNLSVRILFTVIEDIKISLHIDLLKAYSMWLPEERHKPLAKLWPPSGRPVNSK